MTNLRRTLSLLALLLGLAVSAPAYAQDPSAAPAATAEPPPSVPAAAPSASPLSGVSFMRYKLDREKGDIPVEKGRVFLADLKAASPETWASVVDAVRLEIQKDEAEKFSHQKGYVLYAYGAIWVILIVFVIGVFARQRKLAAELAELERRVSVERK